MAKMDQALIVGGGIAGMSCAIQLRKIGIAVDLVEIDADWRAYGAGLTITGPTLRALRSIGVLDEVKAQGATWSGAKVHDADGRLLEEIPIPPLSDDLPATGGIMRPVLHRILSAKTLEGGTNVQLGKTVASLHEGEHDVEAIFSDGSRGRYDLAIGADGIFSSIRKQVFADAAQPHFTGQVVYRLVAERPAGFDRSHFFMGTDTKVGFNPVSATHMYMFLLHPAPDNPHIPTEEQPARLYERMAGFGGFVPQIRETVLTSNRDSVNYKPLEIFLQPAPWHKGHVLLIGDAAHATTPHLASGAGMAIEDGIVLAEELGKGDGLAPALERFMARRYDRCRQVIENSVRLGQMEMAHASPHEHGTLMAESLRILRAPI